MRFNSHLDRSHYGLLRPLRDAEVVTDSLTRMHSAITGWKDVDWI
jgi:hypothetical protein